MKYKLIDKLVVVNEREFFIIPTISIIRHETEIGKAWSIEFHFLLFHAGLLFKEAGGINGREM